MQEIIVGLIVLVAALYAAWTFMPARWRQRLAAQAGLKRVPGGGCHDCDSCAACDAPAPAKSIK